MNAAFDALTALGATAGWCALVPLGLLRLRSRPAPSLALLAAALLGVLARGGMALLSAAGVAVATDAAAFVWLVTSVPQDDVAPLAETVGTAMVALAEIPAWLLLFVGVWGMVRARAPAGVRADGDATRREP